MKSKLLSSKLVLHSFNDKPARISSQNEIREDWYKDGKRHRDSEPAEVIKWKENEVLIYWKKGKQLHHETHTNKQK